MKDFKMLMPVRRVPLRMFGYDCVITANNVDNEHIQKALDEAYSSIVQTAYIEYTLADMMFIRLKDYLSDKGYYRHKVKKLFNDSQRDLRRAMSICEMCINKEYYNEMSCFHYDNIKNDIDSLRKCIATKLSNLGITNPGLCAWLITTYNVLLASMDFFERVYKREYDRFGIDLHDAFEVITAYRAYKNFRELLYSVMGNAVDIYTHNIVDDKQVKKIWKCIFDTIFCKQNTIASRKEAFENLSKDEQERWIMKADGDLEPVVTQFD
jgi:hypothetical protein